MSAIIYSKKTNQEVADLSANVVAHIANYDARVVGVDATLTEFQTNYASHLENFDLEKEYRDAQKADIDASLADVEASADAEKARVAIRESEIDASLNAVVSQAVADKAELQASITALESASSGASGALATRVNDLEEKVGADLTATINTALDDGIVRATLDSFLARDDDVITKLGDALTARVSADDAIKAKFDLLVAKLFEGLEFTGVTQAELSFGPVEAEEPVGAVKLPDGTTVASVDDIIMGEWVINDGHNVVGVKIFDEEPDVVYWFLQEGPFTYWGRFNRETGEKIGQAQASMNWQDVTPSTVGTGARFDLRLR